MKIPKWVKRGAQILAAVVAIAVVVAFPAVAVLIAGVVLTGVMTGGVGVALLSDSGDQSNDKELDNKLKVMDALELQDKLEKKQAELNTYKNKNDPEAKKLEKEIVKLEKSVKNAAKDAGIPLENMPQELFKRKTAAFQSAVEIQANLELDKKALISLNTNKQFINPADKNAIKAIDSKILSLQAQVKEKEKLLPIRMEQAGISTTKDQNKFKIAVKNKVEARSSNVSTSFKKYESESKGLFEVKISKSTDPVTSKPSTENQNSTKVKHKRI